MKRDWPEIVVLHQQYGPYHVARARAFERRWPRRVHFVQLASREASREWRIDGPSPPVITIADGTLEQMSKLQLAGMVQQRLDELRPGAVVIAGYAHAAMRAAARWCRRNRALSILLSDSHQADRRRRRVKEIAKRIWVSRSFDAAFTAGAASAAYAQSLGFAASQIWRGYDVVDNASFAAYADDARARAPSLLRDLGLPKNVFLYVGRFSPEKNLDALLDALVQYRSSAGPNAWGLLLVGGGPGAEALKRRAAAIGPAVAIAGFKQGKELAEAYAVSAALILPSTSEPWGLVVNEAMAAGLPVIVSERAGASLDLVFPGINGYIFDPDSEHDMVRAMLRISDERVDRQSMGLASRRIVANFTPETWAAALADCIEVTLDRRSGST